MERNSFQFVCVPYVLLNNRVIYPFVNSNQKQAEAKE